MGINKDITETLDKKAPRMYWYRSEWRKGPVPTSLNNLTCSTVGKQLVRRAADPSHTYLTVGVASRYQGIKDSGDFLLVKSSQFNQETIYRLSNNNGIEYLVTELIGWELPSRGIID